MKGKKYKTHAIFTCHDCEKRWEDYKTAQRLAREHAEKYGHCVVGEIGIAYHYNGGGG